MEIHSYCSDTGLLQLRAEHTHKQVIRHVSCPEEVVVQMHMAERGW